MATVVYILFKALQWAGLISLASIRKKLQPKLHRKLNDGMLEGEKTGRVLAKTMLLFFNDKLIFPWTMEIKDFSTKRNLKFPK